MAKGRGQPHSKGKNRQDKRKGDRAPMVEALRAKAGTPPTEHHGLASTRGPVSGAYRSWVAEYGRRHAALVADEHERGTVSPSPDLFVLAPLTSRTVRTPDAGVIQVQMGLPIVGTRNGGIVVSPDRLAIAALRLAEPDPSGALAMFGLGGAAETAPPEPLFATLVSAEGLRAVRAADAVAWATARAVEAGDARADPEGIAATVTSALALLRPHEVPSSTVRLAPEDFDSYQGYGDDADEEVVPPDIERRPTEEGVPSLPTGPYLRDTGEPLQPVLADLRDYVIGLWPYEYFALDKLTTETKSLETGNGRRERIALLAETVRRIDDALLQIIISTERSLASEGHPPAWIADETSTYRAAREELRASEEATTLAALLGPLLFNLDVPPPDYVPPSLDQIDEEKDEPRRT